MTVQELYDEACTLHREKNFAATLKVLGEIKILDPNFKRAYYLEAWTWELLGDSEKKFQALEKILPLLNFSAPEEKNFAEEILQRVYSAACEQYNKKNFDAALKILDEIKMCDPNFKRAYYLEAKVWDDLGDSEKKFRALEKILPLLNFSAPEEKNFAEEILWLVYSAAQEQLEKKNYDAVFKILDEIKRRNPKFRSAYYLEAQTWASLGNFVKEYYALEKILPLINFSAPEEKNFAADVLSHLGEACAELRLLDEAKKFYTLTTKILSPPKTEQAVTALIFRENLREDSTLESFRALYDEYKKILTDIKPFPKKFYAHKKIRVGFLSGNFYAHVVVQWSRSLLTGLDKNFFATYFYSARKKKDFVTEKLRASADGWRDIFDLTDEDAAKLIRADEIDILFDLDGYTQNNRLRAAAYHPASVQLSGIGYVNSTGLDCFDYFLSDETCAGDENFFTEKVLKLPHSHFCYEPTTKFEPADFPPCVKNNFVTFGSFNQFQKITDSILRAWKKILDAVPDSRLLLKTKIFNTEDGKKFVGGRLKSFGFDLGRVEMRGFSSDWLAQYADVDIALDTFPYTGGVTTCEALYMGVPVVSLFGQRHGSRFGLSILKNIGLEELAVNSFDEYIARAVMLANDWELLTLLRKNLRPMMKNSPLMDSENYLREIQSAFVKILDEQKIFPSAKA